MNNKNIIISILVLLVVILAITTTYLFTINKDQIFKPANQNSYTIPATNELGNVSVYQSRHGFSFEYPKEWEQPAERAGFLSGGAPYKKSDWSLLLKSTDEQSITIAGFNGVSYKELLNSMRNNQFVGQISEIKINELPAISYFESGMTEYYGVLIFLPEKTLLVSGNSEAQKIIYQITSTFKQIN